MPQVRGSPCPSVAVGAGAGPQGEAPRPPWHLDYTIELLIKFVLIVSDAIFCVILASPTVSPLKVGLLLSCTSSVSVPSGKSFHSIVLNTFCKATSQTSLNSFFGDHYFASMSS